MDSDDDCVLFSASQDIEKSLRIQEHNYETDDDRIEPSQVCNDEEKKTDSQITPVSSARHAGPVDDSFLDEMAKSSHPINTLKRNKWAVNTFNSWAISRNNRSQGHETIGSVDTMNNAELGNSLSRFVCEVRKMDGSEYPPRSLFSLIMGIQGHLKVNMKRKVDFLRHKDFENFRQVLDGRMKGLVRKGMGTVAKQAQAFSVEEEDMLWQKNILGDHNPKVLLRTILFLNGKHFALRSGNEHRSLRYKKSQIQLHESDGKSYLEYSEDSSKCNQGGLKHLRVKPKVARIYESDNKQRCHIRLFRKYTDLCPKIGRDDAFYLTPLQKYHDKIWFSRQPVGHNTLQKLIPTACSEAGIKGHRTNHSLRATAATALYKAGIDEQLIMEQTGHVSLSGVRSYKRSSEDMKRAVSDVLNCKRPKYESPDPNQSESDHITSDPSGVRNCQYSFHNCTVQFM